MSQAWEYCRLQLDAGAYSKSQAVKQYPYYIRVQMEYFGATEPVSTSHMEDSDQMERPNTVWGRSLGLLGAAGWELVSVNLGKVKDNTLVDATAYFKRPVEAGRRTDEPRIKLS